MALAISTYFTVPVSQVVTLHTAGWGYGEIFKLYRFSLASGKTVTEVKALRDAGMGWGNIAKQLNVHPGNAGVNLGAAVSERQVLAMTAPNMIQPQTPRENKQEPGRRNNGSGHGNPGPKTDHAAGQPGGNDNKSNHDNNGNHGNGKPEKPKKDK